VIVVIVFVIVFVSIVVVRVVVGVVEGCGWWLLSLLSVGLVVGRCCRFRRFCKFFFLLQLFGVKFILEENATPKIYKSHRSQKQGNSPVVTRMYNECECRARKYLFFLKY
jgi:hypothetical protein